MKWKGIELKQVVDHHIPNLPKKMFVWNDEYDGEPKERIVCGAVVDSAGNALFITHKCGCAGVVSYFHCAEIPEEEKPRRATHRELAKWLAQGKGEWRYGDSDRVHANIGFVYDCNKQHEIVDEKVKIRKWDDTEWHEPTVDYLGIKEGE